MEAIILFGIDFGWQPLLERNQNAKRKTQGHHVMRYSTTLAEFDAVLFCFVLFIWLIHLIISFILPDSEVYSAILNKGICYMHQLQHYPFPFSIPCNLEKFFIPFQIFYKQKKAKLITPDIHPFIIIREEKGREICGPRLNSNKIRQCGMPFGSKNKVCQKDDTFNSNTRTPVSSKCK